MEIEYHNKKIEKTIKDIQTLIEKIGPEMARMVKKRKNQIEEIIIHPGDTIKELLEENNMSQEELAERTSFSPKHISEVVNGKKRISASLAKGLEYVFGINTTFWLNLQSIYDKEMLEFEEKNNITKEEIEISKKIEPILKYAYSLNLIDKYNNDIERVILARSFCKINNLSNIEKILKLQVAYKRIDKQKIDDYILYAWQRICELLASKEEIENEYNKEKLINNIEKIKLIMFEENTNLMISKMKEILKECGIIFQVVEYFQGAPIQGFIEKNNENIILSITTKESYANIFWYTIFHEIAHILNDDIQTNKIDYYIENSKIEEKADIIAKNILIKEDTYKEFIKNNNFTKEEIKNFSKKNNIREFILIERLEKDNLISYNLYKDLKISYEWNNNT